MEKVFHMYGEESQVKNENIDDDVKNIADIAISEVKSLADDNVKIEFDSPFVATPINSLTSADTVDGDHSLARNVDSNIKIEINPSSSAATPVCTMASDESDGVQSLTSNADDDIEIEFESPSSAVTHVNSLTNADIGDELAAYNDVSNHDNIDLPSLAATPINSMTSSDSSELIHRVPRLEKAMNIDESQAGNDNSEANGNDIDSSSITATPSNPITSADVDDDDYKAIRRCFLMTGKGRRPDVPTFKIATNRLLLQLHFIKEEKQISFVKMMPWLEALVPDKLYPHNIVRFKVTTLLRDYCTLDPSKRLDFLNEEFDPDVLDPVLASIGLTRKHLDDAIPYSEPPGHITNEAVIKLERFRIKEKKTHLFLHKWLERFSLDYETLTHTQFRTKIDSLIKTLNSLRKGKKDDERAKFLNETFKVVSKPTIKPECQSCFLKDKHIIKLNQSIKAFQKSLDQLEAKQKKLNWKAENNLDVIKELQKEKSSLRATVKKLNQENAWIKNELKCSSQNQCSTKEKVTEALSKGKSALLDKGNLKKKRKVDKMLTESESEVLLNP